MLNTKEAAKELGVTTQSILNYIKRNELKAIWVYKGKQREPRIKHCDIMKFKKEFMQMPYCVEVQFHAKKSVGNIYYHEGNKKIVKIIRETLENEIYHYKLNIIDV